MKIRVGFVSNSSSLSYVVIGSGDILKPTCEYYTDDAGRLAINGKLATGKFGWGPDIIKGWEEMLAFAYMQVYYSNNDAWLQMLDSVVRAHLNISGISWPYSETSDSKKTVHIEQVARLELPDGWYIDHQSNASEYMNTEIFDSEDALRRFIFAEDSHVVLDNDNK